MIFSVQTQGFVLKGCLHSVWGPWLKTGQFYMQSSWLRPYLHHVFYQATPWDHCAPALLSPGPGPGTGSWPKQQSLHLRSHTVTPPILEAHEPHQIHFVFHTDTVLTELASVSLSPRQSPLILAGSILSFPCVSNHKSAFHLSGFSVWHPDIKRTFLPPIKHPKDREEPSRAILRCIRQVKHTVWCSPTAIWKAFTKYPDCLLIQLSQY